MQNYNDYDVYNVSSFLDLLKYSSSKYSKKIFIETCFEKISYTDFEQKVLATSKELLNYKGKYILLDIAHPHYFAIAYFAVIICGGIAILNECKEDIFIDFVINDDFINEVSKNKIVDYEEIPRLNVNSVCTILNSSGTTSKKKHIMLSQNNLCSNVVAGLKKFEIKESDKLINILPYNHAFGIVCDLLAPMLAGATIYCLKNKMMFFSLIPEIEPTILNVPPIIAESILKLIKESGKEKVIGKKLRKLLCGGAHLSEYVSKELREYEINAYGCYGLTECSPCVAVNRDNFYKDGSAGLILDCNEVTFTEENEILVSGSNVMLGYFNDDELTKKTIINGKYHTGDFGYIDDEGFLFITGRKSNLIVFGDGTKCLPEIYEKLIKDNTSANEVMIYSEIENGKVILVLDIYISDYKERESIMKYVNKLKMDHFFDCINFLLEEIQRTKNGKVIRKK